MSVTLTNSKAGKFESKMYHKARFQKLLLRDASPSVSAVSEQRHWRIL